MEKTNFINDGVNSTSDESKLIYHFMKNDIDKFITKRKNLIIFLVLFLLLLIAGIATFKLNEETGIALLIIGGLLSFLMTTMLLTNKVNSKISRLGLVYLPYSQVKFQKGSILIDRSGLLEDTTFDFVNLSPENIMEANAQFKSLKYQITEMPPILSDDKTLALKNSNDLYRKENIKMYKEEVNYLEINGKLEDLFSKTLNFNVNIKAFENNPIFFNKLNEIQNGKPINIIESISETEIKENIQKIDGIVEMYNENGTEVVDVDQLCVDILELINRSLPRLDYTVNNSLNDIIVPTTYMFADIIEKASYNSYCPNCNSDIIENLMEGDYKHDGSKDNRSFFQKNTQMELVDIDQGLWKCPLCNEQTDKPFLKHKLEDELFTPVYDKLYEENYKDRLKIYNHLNDEKRKYAEKADTLFHELLRESRNKSDNIKSKIRTIKSEVMADEMAVKDLTGLLVKYKKIALEKAREIQNDLKDHKEKINEDNERSKQKLNEIASAAKESIEESTSSNAALEREDQAKRDEIQKQIASNTEGMKNIMHAQAKADGVIKDKNFGEKVIDNILGSKSEEGLGRDEKFNK